MKTKDKKLRNKRRKSLARYGIEWKPDEKGYQKAHAYRKADTINTPLKESAKAMSSVFQHTYQDHPVPELSRKEQRKRAEVVSIKQAPKLHSVTDPARASPEELAAQIAALERIVDAATSDKEREFVGPPKPELSLVPSVKKVEAIGKATPEQPVPSRTSANDLKLHSVTVDNGDYTYEELAELIDLKDLELMETKVGYENRIEYLSNQVNELNKALYDLDRGKDVAEFLEAHTTDSEDKMRKRIVYLNQQHINSENALFKARQEVRQLRSQLEDVKRFNNALVLQKNKNDVETGYGYDRTQVLEMVDDLNYFRQENTEQRKEIEQLMYQVDLLNGLRGKPASNVGQTSLKTLANQFNIYMSQHRDDPIRNFLRRSNYSIGQAGALRNYFDKECDTRVLLSEERNVFRHWSKREYKKLRWSVRTRNEIRAIRQIGVNMQRYRKVEIPDQHCKVFAKLHSVTDVGASNVYDVRLRPLASSIDADAYCKVWSEFKAVTPRCEYEQQREQERKEAVLASVKGSPVFKVVKAALVTGRAVKSVLNYELSSKKRNESVRIAMLEAKRMEEEASSIKRMREEEFEQSINKEVLRRRMLGLPDHV